MKLLEYQAKDLLRQAGFRQDLSALENRAAASGLNYIKLDGDVGCMVNGAGLAWPQWT